MWRERASAGREIKLHDSSPRGAELLGPRPEGANRSAYPSAYRVFKPSSFVFLFKSRRSFSWRGGSPSELYRDAVAAAADHCADPGAPPLPISAHPGTTRSDQPGALTASGRAGAEHCPMARRCSTVVVADSAEGGALGTRPASVSVTALAGRTLLASTFPTKPPRTAAHRRGRLQL